MISESYEKCSLEIIELSFSDTLTTSAVVNTTVGEGTTIALPTTTSAAGGDMEIPFDSFFQ